MNKHILLESMITDLRSARAIVPFAIKENGHCVFVTEKAFEQIQFDLRGPNASTVMACGDGTVSMYIGELGVRIATGSRRP